MTTSDRVVVRGPLEAKGSRVIETAVPTIVKVRERLWSDGCRTGVEAAEVHHEHFHELIDRVTAYRAEHDTK